MSASTLYRVLRYHRPSSYGSGYRGYSSFFSSNKSGGGGGNGRYVNSTKVPKTVAPGNAANKNNANKSKKADTPATDTVDNVHAGPASSSGISAKPEQEAASGLPSTPSESSNAVARSQETASTQTLADSSGHERSLRALLRDSPQQSHPSVAAKDFKIHQFFSLHRPLLLLSTPGSILDTLPANTTFGPTPPAELAPDGSANTASGQRSVWLLDESPEATLDADAATARQLARALTLTHAGAAVAWEDTMRRLGLDVAKDVERVEMKEQMERDWEEVMMDSTKRKRRKKMKKHKLKKRRKATRATRLKIGR